ncbi:hypothetical protein MJ547_04535, partial [Burkholderia gladioli]
MGVFLAVAVNIVLIGLIVAGFVVFLSWLLIGYARDLVQAHRRRTVVIPMFEQMFHDLGRVAHDVPHVIRWIRSRSKK